MKHIAMTLPIMFVCNCKVDECQLAEYVVVCLDRSAPANVELLVELFVVLTARDHGGAQVEAGQWPGGAHLLHLDQAGVDGLVLVYNGLQSSTFREGSISMFKKSKFPPFLQGEKNKILT